MRKVLAADDNSGNDLESKREAQARHPSLSIWRGALASIGKSVLVFDLDGQGDLTTGVGFDDEVFADSGSNIYTLLADSLNAVLAAIRPAPNDRFDVMPGKIQMYLADKALFTVHDRERRLERVLEAIDDSYDYILIDCPPSLGTVTDNALLARRHVLVPARMNKKNTRAITILLDQIETLEDAFRVGIEVLGIVPVGYVPDTDQKQILEELRKNMSGLFGACDSQTGDPDRGCLAIRLLHR